MRDRVGKKGEGLFRSIFFATATPPFLFQWARPQGSDDAFESNESFERGQFFTHTAKIIILQIMTEQKDPSRKK